MNEIRNRIHKIDDQLVELFRQRMEAASQIATYKRRHGLRSYDPVQERELLNRVTKQAGQGLAVDTKVLYHCLLCLSRARQDVILQESDPQLEGLRRAVRDADPRRIFPDTGEIACQGAEGAYTLQAAERFMKHPNPQFYATSEEVFDAVKKGRCDYGILPIENCNAGSVNSVYDLFRKYHFFIVCGVKLHIRHRLLTLPGVRLESVREIYSHDNAFAQCSAFLHANPQIKYVSVGNTAVAAKKVAESGREDVAAIGALACAKLYGLSAVNVDVQNPGSNFTRFVCVSKDLEIFPGANRTSITLTLPHRQGVLYTLMALISAYDINLQKLESRSIPGNDSVLRFYLDMDASPWAPNFIPLITSLKSASESFSYLGSYIEIA